MVGGQGEDVEVRSPARGGPDLQGLARQRRERVAQHGRALLPQDWVPLRRGLPHPALRDRRDEQDRADLRLERPIGAGGAGHRREHHQLMSEGGQVLGALQRNEARREGERPREREWLRGGPEQAESS